MASAHTTFEVLFWVCTFGCLCLLMFCTAYTLILFSDLLIDFINPVELCDRLNQLLYEIGRITHA